jgi:hypothetical protein
MWTESLKSYGLGSAWNPIDLALLTRIHLNFTYHAESKPTLKAVLRIRIRDPVPFYLWIRDG